jgi:hypothetical protein
MRYIQRRHDVQASKREQQQQIQQNNQKYFKAILKLIYSSFF